jgi:hypothetical protein
MNEAMMASLFGPRPTVLKKDHDQPDSVRYAGDASNNTKLQKWEWEMRSRTLLPMEGDEFPPLITPSHPFC